MKRRMRIGVLGAGHWGPNLIRNFHVNPQSVVSDVVDINAKRLELIKGRYPDIRVSEHPDDVFTRCEIDAVVICTPTSTHYELTKRALESDKHVFVEKPLANTVEGCGLLTNLAKERNRTLFVGHIFVYNAGIQAVCNYINDGHLGKIYYIQITRTNLGPIRDDVNVLWDLVPHDLSILNYWLKDAPQKVSAVGGCFLGNNREDTVFATYTFNNNIMANVHASWLNPRKIREIVVVGDKKMLVWDDMDLSSPVKIYDKNVRFERCDDNNKLVDTYMNFRASIFEGDTLIPSIRLNEPLAAECSAFLNAIRNPEASLSTAEHGTMVVKSLVATDKSLKENGKEIAIS